MSGIVYAAATAVTAFNGARIHLTEDDAWVADDPFVKARPEFFRDRPRNLFSSAGRVTAAPVEDATARPGEKRTTRRG